jgi:hypothetical protein
VPTTQLSRGASGADLIHRLYWRSPARSVRRALAHRRVTDADVFLASYPRSGSSWLRFIVFEMVAGDATFDALPTFTPELHELPVARPSLPGGGRVVKTHEQYRSIYRRAIHLVRDPRDVAISYFRYMQRIEKIVIRPGDDLDASFDAFVSAMVAGRVDPFGTWQAHLDSWLRAARDSSADVFLVRYEDLRAQPESKIADIADFLGLALTDSEVARVVERTRLERMREDERQTMAAARSNFGRLGRRTGVGVINTGRVEAWRERMTPEQVARFAAFDRGLKHMGYPLT